MMKFGVLSDMVGITEKTLKKLSNQQVKVFNFYLLFILTFSPTSLLSMFRVRIGSSFYLRTRKW